MDISTIFWTVFMISVVVGPFIYFANKAFKNEKAK